MKFEGYTAKQEYEPALDADLFKRFQQSKIDVLPRLTPDNDTLEAQKAAFLREEIPCPHFTYEKIKDAELDEKEAALLDLKKELRERHGVPKTLDQTYVWAINERVAKIRMLKEMQAVANGGDSARHMKRFSRYSEFIYGKPDAAIFAAMHATLEQKLDEAAAHLPPEHQERYARLRELAARMRPETAEASDFVDTSKEPGEVVTDVETIKQLFADALQEIGLDAEWKVVVDEKKENIVVSPGKKVITLPGEEQLRLRPSERQMTPEMIRGLIVHEIGTHALRNHNGIRSRVKLLSIGLDRYEEGEEGLATYREQQETGASDYAGFDNYLAAGLAYGLDGQAPRDFAEVHALLTDYYAVCDGADTARAKELAWKRCMRIFRGTTGDIPGVIFTKDTIYRKGNMATYRLMKTDAAEKIDFNLGKFDPTNPRHIGVLVELGVLDQDLKDLEAQ